jgi:hypothetical protein
LSGDVYYRERLGSAAAQRADHESRGFPVFKDSADGTWMSALFRFDLNREIRSDARTPPGIRIGDHDSHVLPFA